MLKMLALPSDLLGSLVFAIFCAGLSVLYFSISRRPEVAAAFARLSPLTLLLGKTGDQRFAVKLFIAAGIFGATGGFACVAYTVMVEAF